jgi:hypothetical protein
MALDVSQDPQTKNKMLLWSKHQQKNQLFRIKEQDGKYLILSSSGATLEVPNNSTAKGVQMYVNQPNNTPNEYWHIIPAKGEKDGFFIKSFCGKCLDVCESKTSNGTPVIQWDYNGGKNQIWYIQAV